MEKLMTAMIKEAAAKIAAAGGFQNFATAEVAEGTLAVTVSEARNALQHVRHQTKNWSLNGKKIAAAKVLTLTEKVGA